jgi:hypothetical protein
MKPLIALAVAIPLVAAAQDKLKTLQYQFNENVLISISNVQCPLDKLRKDYPLSVVAFRRDGQKLFGCYTNKGDDIVIQWAAGDKSIFPANLFLQGDTI